MGGVWCRLHYEVRNIHTYTRHTSLLSNSHGFLHVASQGIDDAHDAVQDQVGVVGGIVLPVRGQFRSGFEVTVGKT